MYMLYIYIYIFKSAVMNLPVRDHTPFQPQLRERAQAICPWRVGFELGPSHKSGAASFVCAGHTGWYN